MAGEKKKDNKGMVWWFGLVRWSLITYEIKAQSLVLWDLQKLKCETEIDLLECL